MMIVFCFRFFSIACGVFDYGNTFVSFTCQTKEDYNLELPSVTSEPRSMSDPRSASLKRAESVCWHEKKLEMENCSISFLVP